MKARAQNDLRRGFDHAAIGVAHNHLQGSAHCVECLGPCQLTDPTQSAYTGLIRALLESEVYGHGKMPYQAEWFLKEHGIDVDALRRRRDDPNAMANDATRKQQHQ